MQACGQYVVLALIFKKINFEQRELKTYFTDFDQFSPYGRHLIVDCQLGPRFPNGSRDVAMTTNFRVKIGKIVLFTFIRVAPTLATL